MTSAFFLLSLKLNKLRDSAPIKAHAALRVKTLTYGRGLGSGGLFRGVTATVQLCQSLHLHLEPAFTRAQPDVCTTRLDTFSRSAGTPPLHKPNPMGHQDREMDVESLQKSGRRRGGCLEAFLVTSIIFLFVAVVALAVGGTIFVMKLESEMQSPRSSIHLGLSKLTGDSPDPAYKMNKFVYLDAISSDLKNITMHWAPVSYGSGKSVGSNFDFDEAQSFLRPKQEGTYFMYMDLNITCPYKCPAGVLSVHVGNKLTCNVQLPALSDSTPVTKKCWTVSQMQGEKLFTQIIVPENGLEYWKLEQLGSGFGMFLVD